MPKFKFGGMERLRVSLRDRFTQTGLSAREVDEVIDLSSHAVSEMFAALHRVADTANGMRDRALVLVTGLEILNHVDLNEVMQSIVNTIGTSWEQVHPGATPDHLGMIPTFLSPSIDRPAAEQINAK